MPSIEIQRSGNVFREVEKQQQNARFAYEGATLRNKDAVVDELARLVGMLPEDQRQNIVFDSVEGDRYTSQTFFNPSDMSLRLRYVNKPETIKPTRSRRKTSSQPTTSTFDDKFSEEGAFLYGSEPWFLHGAKVAIELINRLETNVQEQ